MSTSDSKEALVKVLSCDTAENAVKQLLELFVQYESRTGLHSSISDAVAELSEDRHNKLWTLLGDAFNTVMAHYIAEEQEGHQQDNDAVSSERVLLCVLRLALCCVRVLQPSKQGEQPRVAGTLVTMIGVVGGVLELLEGPLFTVAVTVCEEWTHSGLPDASSFSRQLLTALVKLSVEPNAKKTDVRRVYQQRAALKAALTPTPPEECADAAVIVTEECVGNMATVLCGCLVSPVYLSCDDGIKFLGMVMMHRACTALCHSAVKDTLPHCSRSQAAKLAQVYCRAWRGLQDKKSLEEDCLQDIMYRYMTVDPVSSSHLLGNMCSFLHVLHAHQKLPEFSTMLQRLYNPFLWRSLNFANGLARANATTVLCDAYPMVDVSSSQEERELHLTRANRALTTALTDDCHVVRIAAIQGVCRILHSYWLLLPKAVIQNWFTVMLTRLAADASSAQVRLQVVKGMSVVLDCQDALPFLKHCLPELGGCFDDINASVRVAMVRLLLRLQALKLIKFWHVVPVPHLLHRLAIETPAVSKLITRLLSAAFVPIDKEDTDLVERSISLIEENRLASRVFYQYVTQGLDVGSVVRLMLLLFRALKGYLLHKQQMQGEGQFDLSADFTKNHGKRLSNDAADGDKENEVSGDVTASASNTVILQPDDDDEEEEGCPFDDPRVVGGVLDTLVILWTSNAHKLTAQHNAKWLQLLQKKVSRGLPLLSSCFRGNHELSCTLLHLASFLPRGLVPTLVGHSLSQLRSLTPQDVADQDKGDGAGYTNYVNALCNWNRADDLLELIEDWLAAALTVQGTNLNDTRSSPANRRASSSSARGSSSSARRRRSSSSSARRVRFSMNTSRTVPKPEVAIALLRALLVHRLNRMTLLHKNRKQLRQLMHVMENVKVCLSSRLAGDTSDGTDCCSTQFLLSCWQEYLCVVALLHHQQSPPPQQEQHGRRSRDSSDAAVVLVEEFDAAQHYRGCVEWVKRIALPKLTPTSTATPPNSSCRSNNSSGVDNWSTVVNTSVLSASRRNTKRGGGGRGRGRTRKLRAEDSATMLLCPDDSATCDTINNTSCDATSSSATDEATRLPKAVVCTLLKMCCGVMATNVAEPQLVDAVLDLATEAVQKDAGCEVLSCCIPVATETYLYLKAYQSQYTAHRRPAVLPAAVGAPDVALLSTCVTAAVQHLANGTKGTVPRHLTDSLACMASDSSNFSAGKLQAVVRHIVLVCLQHIVASGVQSTDAISQSGVGVVVSVMKSRIALAGPFSDALHHTIQHHTQTIQDRIAALHFLKYLQSEPGKVAARSLQAAVSAVDQLLPPEGATVELASTPRTAPAVSRLGGSPRDGGADAGTAASDAGTAASDAGTPVISTTSILNAADASTPATNAATSVINAADAINASTPVINAARASNDVSVANSVAPSANTVRRRSRRSSCVSSALINSADESVGSACIVSAANTSTSGSGRRRSSYGTNIHNSSNDVSVSNVSNSISNTPSRAGRRSSLRAVPRSAAAGDTMEHVADITSVDNTVSENSMEDSSHVLKDSNNSDDSMNGVGKRPPTVATSPDVSKGNNKENESDEMSATDVSKHLDNFSDDSSGRRKRGSLDCPHDEIDPVTQARKLLMDLKVSMQMS